MSVIVAIKDKSRIVVGVDVRMSACETYIDSYPRRPKAFHINDKRDVIVGGVGNVGIVDILKEILSDYEESDLYKIDRSFIVKYILPTLITSVRDYEMLDKENQMDAELLIAIKDKAFVIAGNYSVAEIVKYVAIGSGSEVAMGSLYTSSLCSMTTEERIKVAIESAGSFINTVSKLSYIGDTSGKIFTPSKA